MSKHTDADSALDLVAGSARPLYASTDFKEYCAEQKAKGLNRSLWRHLPEMWEDELQFRADFEEALAKAGSPPNTKTCRDCGATDHE